MPRSACEANIDRRALIGGALGAAIFSSRPARAAAAAEGIAPEQFGAAGDGRRDDSQAIASALAAAAARGVPLFLGEGRRYALGRPGWRGIETALRGSLTIEGRGATLALQAAPAQNFAVGSGHSALRFTGGSIAVRNLEFDLGGHEAAAFEFSDTALHVEGCGFANGAASRTSFALYVNRSSGAILSNRARNLGHFCYLGHTDPGWHGRNLRVSGNRADNLAADFAVGVIKDSTISDNVADGMFGGVALAAFARMGSVSERVTVSGNRFSNFRANGIQSDTIGDLRVRDIHIRDNILSNGGPNAAGLYLLRIDGFEADHNTIDNVSFGIVLDHAARGTVTRNRISAGARRPVTGLYIVGNLGPVEDVELSANVVTGFETGMSSGGSPTGGVRRVALRNNQFTGGGRGIVVIEPAADLVVDGNVASGNREAGIAIHARGVRLGTNRSGSR